MRYLFLFLMLLAAGSAAAQNSVATARPDSLAAAQATPDTVAAIHHLFAAKRKRRNIIAGAIIVGAAGAATASSAGNDHFLNQEETFKLYGIMAAVCIGIDFLVGVSYSRSNEKYAIEDFHAHQLSRHLKRKLRHKHKYFPDVPSSKHH